MASQKPITAVLKRLSELNIASAKVLTIPELEAIHNTWLESQLLNGKR